MVTIITLFTIAHALAGAAWFGAMFYSLTVLQPRAMLFFDNKTEIGILANTF